MSFMLQPLNSKKKALVHTAQGTGWAKGLFGIDAKRKMYAQSLS
jgi:hypothetical protein